MKVEAGKLTVEGGAQIASATAGPGKGGDVSITVASDIILPDQGPQITAQSTGSGDAGSITVSAVRLLMNNGAGISTEAVTSTANGGNITLHLSDFLYLVSSEITASVKGEAGNGGNIAIDPQLAILDHSRVIADAIEGHGGNVTISADELIVSSDSTNPCYWRQLSFNGLVNANGALVVLSTQLRSRIEILREACTARGDRPISNLSQIRSRRPAAGPRSHPSRTLHRGPRPQPERAFAEKSIEASTPLQTTVRLTMRCGDRWSTPGANAPLQLG